jgi:hypothetical protein
MPMAGIADWYMLPAVRERITERFRGVLTNPR